VPAAVGSALPAAAASSPPAVPPLDLTDIQGNVFGGFNKDNQTFIAVLFPSVGAGRAWVNSVRAHVASSAEVVAFNNAFRSVASRAGAQTTLLTSSWTNVALTYDGLVALGVNASDLSLFPQEFRGGMAARALHLGDTGKSSPSNWPLPFQRRAHALLLLAADTTTDLTALVTQQTALAKQLGVKVLWTQQGSVRVDEPGHEHFGFKDGISQPGVRGVTTPTDPTNPDQGVPGQDLLWPGEFVIGQPTQAGVGQPITSAGPPSIGGPLWTTNGSYLVFRRLTQDVAGFRDFVAQSAAAQGISSDLMGAKMMGRYKSGAALESSGAKAGDPGASDPSLLGDNVVNNFEYGNDPDGAVVPLAAHIRKAYPRDEPTKDGGESDTQTHRIIRRGIPFGTSLPPETASTDPAARPVFPSDRGLLFLCYQSSIRRQFEFIQNHWVNDPNFPRLDSGQDPVVSQSDGTGSFTLPNGRPNHIALMQRFVTTTGGDYFFQPSLTALGLLAQGLPAPLQAPQPPPVQGAPATAQPVVGSPRPAGAAPAPRRRRPRRRAKGRRPSR
jgi:Dyp-type peroxidase family